MKDIRLPFILILITIALLAFCKSAPAAQLTAEQRALVTGLTANNKELTAKVAAMEQQISEDAAKQVFAAQKIESLTGNLITAKHNEEAQYQDLLLQAGKITALESDRDFQLNRAEKLFGERNMARLEAHRNAVERDISCFISAAAATCLVMIYSGQIIGWITSKFPALTPYGIGLWIGLAILTFLSTFGASRGVLAMIASRL